MGRVYTPLTIVIISLLVTFPISILLQGPAGNYVYDKIGENNIEKILTSAWTYRYPAIVLIVVLCLLWLWSFIDSRDRGRHSHFLFVKISNELAPRDLGFYEADSREQRAITLRPFHSVYIQRKLSPHNTNDDTGDQYISEDELRESISQGRGFIVIGRPLEGKTRLVYEIVHHMQGFHVVAPQKDKPTPPREAFHTLSNKHVVVLLDDLNDYVGAPINLRDFLQLVGEQAMVSVVVATCRDGPELESVRQALGSGLSRVYEEVPLKVRLRAPSVAEKVSLSKSLGRHLIPGAQHLAPTFASITMEDAMEAMRERFRLLSPKEKDILRSLQLLVAAGVLPLTQTRAGLVLDGIFGRHASHLVDQLDVLAERGFLARPGRRNPILPEAGPLCL